MLWQQYYSNHSMATVLWQSIIAMVLLQQYYSNDTMAIVLWQQYYSDGLMTTVL